MKTTIRSLLALIALVSLAPLASAQQTFCPPTDPILPGPGPVTDGYFLGVKVSTVPVDLYGGGGGGGGEESGPVTMVVPGAGETVYGQRINYIVPNSPAYNAGLEEGDILLDANGYPMDSLDDLQYAISTSEGILEMKVLDYRSGQLLWVIAETDPTNTSPVYAAQVKSKQMSASRKNRSNGSMQMRPRNNNNPRTFSSPRNNNPRGGNNQRRGSNLRQQVEQASSVLRSLTGGRRGPIRRGGRR